MAPEPTKEPMEPEVEMQTSQLKVAEQDQQRAPEQVVPAPALSHDSQSNASTSQHAQKEHIASNKVVAQMTSITADGEAISGNQRLHQRHRRWLFKNNRPHGLGTNTQLDIEDNEVDIEDGVTNGVENNTIGDAEDLHGTHADDHQLDGEAIDHHIGSQ